MKKGLLPLLLLISCATFAQKTIRTLPQKGSAALTDTILVQNGTTQAVSVQKIYDLLSGSFASISSLNNYLLKSDSVTYASSYDVDTAKKALRVQIATLSAGGLAASSFIVGEVPTGTKNGSNTTFTLANTPAANKEVLYINGVRQKRGMDYTIAGNTITMAAAPKSTDDLLTDYIY
jgi:hypothetical protein